MQIPCAFVEIMDHDQQEAYKLLMQCYTDLHINPINTQVHMEFACFLLIEIHKLKKAQGICMFLAFLDPYVKQMHKECVCLLLVEIKN